LRKCAASGEFADVSEHVRDLVRQDEERGRALAGLQAEIHTGMAGGIGDKSLQEKPG
jgi:antitoxin ParD1/3/4